jgi:hypothetical protein
MFPAQLIVSARTNRLTHMASYQIYHDVSIIGTIYQTADAMIRASQKICYGGLRPSCVAVAAERLRNASNYAVMC